MINIKLALLVLVEGASLYPSENALEILGLENIQSLGKAGQVLRVKMVCFNSLFKIRVKVREHLIDILSCINFIGTELVRPI